MPHTLHLVSHTHWDREWYLTYQQFRMRLVDLIDHLLDLLDRDADFRSFHLDSQTIVLEDYLQIKPHNQHRLEKYIREGRIIVGPWYQLNDEFLTSGEATIRSLLIGIRIANQFGACGTTGYLPDQFGNLSQMPQIFRGFGFDHAVMGRGYQLDGDRKMEFIWASPDGSQVTASLMAFWYNNAQHVPADPQKAVEYMQALRDTLAAHSTVSHLLLMNGVDHLEAQQDLSSILSGLARDWTEGDRVIHSTIQQYMEEVKNEVQGIALQKHTGELRDDRHGSCLAGTLSTRMYLKQANHHAQVTLEKYVEPFASFAMQENHPYPQEYLHYAWKLLMQNHPHDSICGCSVDQVHREMLPRFAQVEQIGEELINRSLEKLAGRVQFAQLAGKGEAGLVVFNSLNWSRTDPVRATIVYLLGIPTRGNPPRDDTLQVSGIALSDAGGSPVPFVVTDTTIRMRPVLSPVELPLDQWVQEISIEFIAENVPACGYQSYRVTPVSVTAQFKPWLEHDSTNWRPVFEDCGDVGDEYLHQKPASDVRLTQPVLGASAVEERSAISHTVSYSSTWDLPVAAEGVLSRLVERVSCPITTRVTRWRGVPRTEYTTTIDNRALDHRLRVVFENQNAAFHAQPYSVAEGQFDVIYRPLTHPLEGEGASPFHPQQNWVALVGHEDGSPQVRTAAVLNQGLPEYEIYQDSSSPSIAVTLLRAVNYLSRRGDGPEIITPEAQCLGQHTFRYSFLETAGDWQQGEIWKQAHQFNVPLRAVQTDLSTAEDSRNLPASLSFITVEPPQLVVTAIKRAEDDDRLLVIRFFNISTDPVTNSRITVRHATAAYLLNLNEQIQQSLELKTEGSVSIQEIRPKQIITLGFRLP